MIHMLAWKFSLSFASGIFFLIKNESRDNVDFYRSVLVLNGNGADVAKHCIPAVPTKR